MCVRLVPTHLCECFSFQLIFRRLMKKTWRRWVWTRARRAALPIHALNWTSRRTFPSSGACRKTRRRSDWEPRRLNQNLIRKLPHDISPEREWLKKVTRHKKHFMPYYASGFATHSHCILPSFTLGDKFFILRKADYC